MKITKRVSVVFFAVVLMAGITGCGGARPKPPTDPTPIAEIQNHPRTWVGKTVLVTGEVKETFSLVVHKQFVIMDPTGEITVVTSKPLPKKGEKLNIEAVVEEGWSIGSETRTVLREKG